MHVYFYMYMYLYMKAAVSFKRYTSQSSSVDNACSTCTWYSTPAQCILKLSLQASIVLEVYTRNDDISNKHYDIML